MPLKLPIYCQLKALESFFAFEPDSKAVDSLLEEKFRQAKNRIDLLDLVLNRSKLYLDIDLDSFLLLAEADIQNRGIIFSLYDSSQRGNRQLSFEPESFYFLENEQASLPTDINPHTLFLLDIEKELCQELERKYGFWFYNVEHIFAKAEFILSSALYNVTKNTSASFRLSDWGDLRNFQHPCNAMVIVDNYIFSPNYRQNIQDNICNNILPLLEILLPKKLNSDFDLTFIIEEKKDTDIDLNLIYTFLASQLPNLGKDYNFNTSIICLKEIRYDSNNPNNSDYTTYQDLKNHDRNIFTNYFWLHSGHSFTYFDNQGDTAKETNLTLHSIFGGFYSNDAGDNAVFDAVRLHLEKCKNICNAQTNTNYYRGNKQNRLL